MELLNHTRQTANDKTKEIKHKALAQTQYATAKAREESQQLYERAQITLRRATLLAAAGSALLQHFMRANEKKLRKQRRELAHKAAHWQERAQDTLHPAWTKTQHTLQDSAEATQNTLKTGLESIQENARKTQKNLQHMQKTARKNLKKGWSSTQESLEAGWSSVQDRVEEGSQQVLSNLAQVATSTKEAKKALQKRYKRHQLKRAWARRLFRWGLVSGFLLALLFAPINGAETRKRIGRLWNQYKQYLTSDQRNEPAL